MKCVCPMGGDRTCPDDCVLSVWANLAPTDRKAQRKPIAEQLYKQGFTMESIATQLGVNHGTISRDLREFVHDAQIKKPAKTASNPKGAGRPKGKKSESRRGEMPAPVTKQAREIVRPLVEDNKPVNRKQLQKEYGISENVFQVATAMEEARQEAIEEKTALDPNFLSKTAQEKLAMAIKQHKRRLDDEFERRVLDEARKRMDEISLPHWKAQVVEAKKLFDKRKALMDKATFNTIRRALHPDSRYAISDRMLGEAFNTFMRLEKYLLNEADSPTAWPDIPSSAQEWDKMRTKPRRPNGPTTIRPR
jgi:IS30 family transposase